MTRSLGLALEFLTGVRVALDDLGDEDARQIRAAQVHAVVQLIPLTMAVNVLNAAIVVRVLWDTGANAFLATWGAMIALIALIGMRTWQQSRRKRPNGASPRAIRRFVLHAFVLSFIWGSMPLVLFPSADLLRQLVIACLMAGMISGGAFCLSTIPAAGLTYTWTMSLASAAALFLAGGEAYGLTAVLLLTYAVFISRNLVAHGNLFVEHLRDKVELRSRGEVIGLLLKDFQDNASDWLWETDETGSLMRVSERFARAAERTLPEIQGALFSDLISGGREHRATEVADILDHMAKRTAFREVVVGVRVGEHQRYWSLTAKPVRDNAGRFIGYRGVGADVTEKRLAEERITYLARYDTTTTLPNRFFFREEADRALAGARERRQSAALLCLDLDHFKSINDTLGYHIGDVLLKRVGERLKACVPGSDIVARLDGDDFAIMHLSPDQPTGTMALVRLIISAFETPFMLGHSAIVIGASIGIAVMSAAGEDTEALLKSADLALDRAKAEGAGTYRFFEPEMEAWAHRRRALEVGLRSALENGEIRLVFQPLVDLRSGAVVGCEALARWNSRDWGEVSPAEFIPVAEETGLIVPIGEWVLREAVRAARRWPGGASVAVNLSPVQFRNQKLLATVAGALAESGLPPQRLELEVTESIFLDGSDQTVAMLNNLRTLGVRIALDDFGTGYSSLSYLRRFPFDKIKIDKSFIDDVATREESTAIIRAIVALAEALGMSTTAEGVETVEQLETLRRLGCSQIQGYLFSRPRLPTDLVEIFNRNADREKSTQDRDFETRATGTAG